MNPGSGADRSAGRWRWLIVVLLLAAAGLAVWLLLPEDSPSPAPVKPGAYAYTTSGFEEIGILGGARHVYPTTTGITIRRSDCGHWLVWRPLRDRSTAYELCGGRLRSIREVHQFFGRRDRRTYRCTESSSLRGWRCTFAGTTEVARGHVVGVERVGGVETVHVRLTTRISGAVEGTGTRDFWLRRSDGFPVRLAATNENSTDSPVGRVHYRESYELELQQRPGLDDAG